MNRFAALLATLDDTPDAAKLAALADYFGAAPGEDSLWALALLSGHRPKRAATPVELRDWALQVTGLPLWLVEASRTLTGDLAETIALILPPATGASPPSLGRLMQSLTALAGQPAETRRAAILDAWANLDPDARFIFNKLVTGSFRQTVPQALLTRALAQATGADEAGIAHRLTTAWTPQTTTFAALTTPDAAKTRPYPFALASPLTGGPETLGPPGDWLAEWQWHGIRAQLISRAAAFALWSGGAEMIHDRFPEFAPLADFLPPGTVIDGTVLAWGTTPECDRPLALTTLQKRLARKAPSPRLLTEVPARLLAHDLLEDAGRDIRDQPLIRRRARLAAILAALPPGLPIALSPALPFADWRGLATDRQRARDQRAEGLILRHLRSPYPGGPGQGDWWHWRPDPLTVTAVMIYARAGDRAGAGAAFTFALRDGDGLVPVTKAGPGLNEAETRQIAQWVQENTLERFGPVRRVPPELVFEIAFDGIQPSPRHKSGVALRRPRVVRWCHDLTADRIDRLESLRALLDAAE